MGKDTFGMQAESSPTRDCLVLLLEVLQVTGLRSVQQVPDGPVHSPVNGRVM